MSGYNTIRCTSCKTITGIVPDPRTPDEGRTVYTVQPCYVCVAEDQLQREKAAAVRLLQAIDTGEVPE